jgi:hypothetical protein
MSIANWILTCTRPKFADLFSAFFALYLAYWRTGRVHVPTQESPFL